MRGSTFGEIPVEASASTTESEEETGRAAPWAKKRSEMVVRISVDGECILEVVGGILLKAVRNSCLAFVDKTVGLDGKVVGNVELTYLEVFDLFRM